MARLSFDEEDLNSLILDDLSPFDKSNLDDWVDKFRNYKAYPIVGRVSTPPPIREFRPDELKNFLGDQEVPVGRVHSPIYVAINGKVLDVSYGKLLLWILDNLLNLFQVGRICTAKGVRINCSPGSMLRAHWLKCPLTRRTSSQVTYPTYQRMNEQH
jgi:hypothetical protein